jgi:hypothetical protein
MTPAQPKNVLCGGFKRLRQIERKYITSIDENIHLRKHFEASQMLDGFSCFTVAEARFALNSSVSKLSFGILPRFTAISR